MGMAEQMKNLSEEILASYKERAASFQQRLKDNAEIVKEVQNTLDGFRKDHMEMAATLRANAATLRSNLEKGQKERLKSFHQMMNGIHNSIFEIEAEVDGIKLSTAGLLKDFSISHNEMATELNEELAKDKTNRLNWNTGRLKQFDGMMKEIHKDIQGVKKEVAEVFGYTDQLLTRFANEHDSMSEAMRADLKANLTERIEYTKRLLNQFDKRLAEMAKENQKMAKALRQDLLKSRKELSKSDVDRLKEFNVTFSRIQKDVRGIQKFVDTFLGDFSADRKEAAATWAKLSAAIAKLGKTPAPQPVAKKEVAVAEKKVAKPEPVVEKPKVEEPVKILTMEEKVLDYINTHKNGVKVSDMEEPSAKPGCGLDLLPKSCLMKVKCKRLIIFIIRLSKNKRHGHKNHMPVLYRDRERLL